MRARLAALIAAAACATAACKKSEPRATPGGLPGHDPAAADALWQLAPPDAVLGVVVTPRAMHLLEDAFGAMTALAAQPEMRMLRPQLDELMRTIAGGPFATFADAGLDRDRGLAIWQVAGGKTVALVPVKDLAVLRKRIGGPAEPDRLGGLVCRPHARGQLCASEAAMLDGLGRAAVPAIVGGLGHRGDVEVVVPAAATALAVQLERGELVVRGTTAAPPPLRPMMGPGAPARVEPASVAFGVAAVRGVLETMPDRPLVTGVSLRQLAATIGGPMTVTIAAGSTVPDLRVPLTDPAPGAALVERCEELAGEQRIAGPPGTCRLDLASYGMQLDLWVEGRELRAGKRDAVPAPVPAADWRTPLATELAAAPWSFAFWGRGTVIGGSAASVLPPGMPVDVKLLARLLTLVNELGIAARLDGDAIHFVVGVRTPWANPPAVTARILGIPPEDIMAGKLDEPRAIAAAAPTAPFAGDLAAGPGGLMVPAAITGMLAAIAVPAFLDYRRRAEAYE